MTMSAQGRELEKHNTVDLRERIAIDERLSAWERDLLLESLRLFSDVQALMARVEAQAQKSRPRLGGRL